MNYRMKDRPTVVAARQVTEKTIIMSLPGAPYPGIVVYPGEWIITDPDGVESVQGAGVFPIFYEPVEEEVHW